MGVAACKPCADSGVCAFCGNVDTLPTVGPIEVDKWSAMSVAERAEGASSSYAQANTSGTVAPEVHLEAEVAECADLGFARAGAEGARVSHTFRSGSVYTGYWRGSARHGVGFQSWPDGASYAGEWRDNQAEGRGSFIFPDGAIYIGEWRGNRFHGLGTLQDTNKTVFRGEWQAGARTGLGVEDIAGAFRTRYAGEFKNGLKDGTGVCTWSDGGEYCGQWSGNQILGAGMYTCHERRRKYIGQWRDSQKHGMGIYEWADGRIYRGRYCVDQASGFGEFSWPDGQRYEGFWQDGKQHGAGMYTGARGEMRQLVWSAGLPTNAEGESSDGV